MTRGQVAQGSFAPFGWSKGGVNMRTGCIFGDQVQHIDEKADELSPDQGDIAASAAAQKRPASPHHGRSFPPSLV